MKKEINIVAPEGYEIDKENSTFECIRFKATQKKKRWRDNEKAKIKGYIMNLASMINVWTGFNTPDNYHVFFTEKQAKSAIAMARISQIMANDERFGGAVTDEEWKDRGIEKPVIMREKDCIFKYSCYTFYHFLAFHTAEQRELFLQENEDLVRDFLMI